VGDTYTIRPVRRSNPNPVVGKRGWKEMQFPKHCVLLMFFRIQDDGQSNPEEQKNLPLKISWQCTLVLLVKVIWTEGKGLESVKKTKYWDVVCFGL
jgi:hypothetical protein